MQFPALLGISALLAVPATAAHASVIGADGGYRLPAAQVRTDMDSAVRAAIGPGGAIDRGGVIAHKPRKLPRAFDELPDTNLNYAARSGGPAVELGVLGSEIGRSRGLVHFALDWDF